MSPSTQYAMPPEFGGLWGAMYLKIILPLPNLLYCGMQYEAEKNFYNCKKNTTKVVC